MDPSTIFFSVVYGVAFLLVLYLTLSQKRPIAPMVNIENASTSWWPWPSTSYNWWSYWNGWWSGGENGGYLIPSVPTVSSYGNRPWGGEGRGANGMIGA